jgi:hypothetical protein
MIVSRLRILLAVILRRYLFVSFIPRLRQLR